MNLKGRRLDKIFKDGVLVKWKILLNYYLIFGYIVVLFVYLYKEWKIVMFCVCLIIFLG